MAASVPDETSRTFSTDGTASTISSASVDLPLGRRAEGRPVCGRLLHGLDDLGVGVAEDERPPGHDPVDVAAALRVLDVRALAAAREERLAGRDGLPRAHRRVDATRDEAPGLA